MSGAGRGFPSFLRQNVRSVLLAFFGSSTGAWSNSPDEVCAGFYTCPALSTEDGALLTLSLPAPTTFGKWPRVTDGEAKHDRVPKFSPGTYLYLKRERKPQELLSKDSDRFRRGYTIAQWEDAGLTPSMTRQISPGRMSNSGQMSRQLSMESDNTASESLSSHESLLGAALVGPPPPATPPAPPGAATEDPKMCSTKFVLPESSASRPKILFAAEDVLTWPRNPGDQQRRLEDRRENGRNGVIVGCPAPDVVLLYPGITRALGLQPRNAVRIQQKSCQVVVASSTAWWGLGLVSNFQCVVPELFGQMYVNFSFHGSCWFISYILVNASYNTKREGIMIHGLLHKKVRIV